MSRPLRLDADDRRSLLLEAHDALERLRSARADAGLHARGDDALIELARAAPPANGHRPEAILDQFVRFAAAGWDKTAGGNLSYIPNGALDAGVIAALLAAGAHTFTGSSWEAPAIVAMEEGVLAWMAEVLGLPRGAGGLLLSGGSLANQTAIATARVRAERDAATGATGASGPVTSGDPGTLTLYASERVHHSVTKAARLAGLPAGAIRLVPVDASGRCDPTMLETTIDADVDRGRRPFLVVGVAGSTDTGSIDPLEALADIAAASGAWFHVDAAYGGFFALTDRGRAWLRGIGRADSVTLDAHKGLFLPYGVGALVVRDPEDLVRAHEGRGAYLRGAQTAAGLPDYFQRGPELTRPSRAPLIWFPLQLHGTAAFARELDRMLDLADLAFEGLAGTTGIVVGPRPETSIVTFRAAAGDTATDRIVEALHATGRFQVSTTTLDGRATVRFAFLSPATTEATVADALEVVARSVDPGAR